MFQFRNLTDLCVVQLDGVQKESARFKQMNTHKRICQTEGRLRRFPCHLQNTIFLNNFRTALQNNNTNPVRLWPPQT